MSCSCAMLYTIEVLVKHTSDTVDVCVGCVHRQEAEAWNQSDS